MSAKPAIIVGAGQRVLQAALPAFQCARELYQVRHLVARTERELEVEGVRYPVRALDALSPADLDGIELVFLCVAKDAIPKVLARLAALGPRRAELLIDTPVVRFKHFRATRHLAAFARASVAEDCTTLPWIDLVRESIAAGEIGETRAVLFLQSAWAYHGIALAKTLLAERSVRSGRRRHLGGEIHTRHLRLGRREAFVLEPRDYGAGRFAIVGSQGVIADYEHGARGARLLEPVVADGVCRGFRLGERELRLDEAEASLMRGVPAGARVTALMEACKRVGFLRLLRRLHAGQGAYPLADALDDMVVDYHLEKLGRWVANPFTSPRSRLGRALLGALTKG